MTQICADYLKNTANLTPSAINLRYFKFTAQASNLTATQLSQGRRVKFSRFYGYLQVAPV
ncbi:hypothetical protein CSUNSWCD_1747 [Campylobacter showae CSUNSWCD]|uniref:Uncharacterized protein n=1 Tax=Campylobacter showae CSUNSWCD TaxID=1244083 RepID=M5IQV9_9BACT|nr:hypothetical protein CSUNSWCD_1747 [Campylobacter showae CSUNSWCD]